MTPTGATISTGTNVQREETAIARRPIHITLLTGCQDKPYAFGIAMALAGRGIRLDVVGNGDVDSPELRSSPCVAFLDYGKLRGGVAKKVWMLLCFYARLIRYAAVSDSRIFHILWNNKVQFFDRTLLMLYYKLLGKKIVLTAHNVNAGKRDGRDTLLNRLTLKAQYALCDHIFVHTERMKQELCDDFGIAAEAVTVIPFGINNAVPKTDLTREQARHRLGLRQNDSVILAFGRIKRYKGLDYLVTAFQQGWATRENRRLLIAGERKKGYEAYFESIQRMIESHPSREHIIQKREFIPDEDTETYFKAADVLVLPYTEVFQSGVLFLAYSFGLPVIASDVGSFREDIVEGRTGFLCKAHDAGDLAAAIDRYFASPLFEGLDSRRQEIRDYAESRNSWRVVADATENVYERLLRSA